MWYERSNDEFQNNFQMSLLRPSTMSKTHTSEQAIKDSEKRNVKQFKQDKWENKWPELCTIQNNISSSLSLLSKEIINSMT